MSTEPGQSEDQSVPQPDQDKASEPITRRAGPSVPVSDEEQAIRDQANNFEFQQRHLSNPGSLQDRLDKTGPGGRPSILDIDSLDAIARDDARQQLEGDMKTTVVEKASKPQHPDISEEDWETHNSVLAQVNGGGKEPGSLSEKLGRAKTYSIAEYRIEEAHDINAARDIAIEFGLDPSLVDNNLVSRRDLKIAKALIDELGLDGKSVYGDAAKRRALEVLIGTEVRIGGAEAGVRFAETILAKAKQKLDEEQVELNREKGENAKARDTLVQVAAGKSNSDIPTA